VDSFKADTSRKWSIEMFYNFLLRAMISNPELLRKLPSLKATSPFADQYCINLKVMKVVRISW
jgi:hypothetical protein